MFATPYFIKYLHKYIHSIIVQYTHISEILFSIHCCFSLGQFFLEISLKLSKPTAPFIISCQGSSASVKRISAILSRKLFIGRSISGLPAYFLRKIFTFSYVSMPSMRRSKRIVERAQVRTFFRKSIKSSTCLLYVPTRFCILTIMGVRKDFPHTNYPKEKDGLHPTHLY